MSKSCRLLALIGLFALTLGTARAANILCAFPSASPSHLIVHLSHARVLVERGHNVTVVTMIPIKEKNHRYNHILIPPTAERYEQMTEMKNSLFKEKSRWDSTMTAMRASSTFGESQADVIKDQKFQDFMNNRDNKFDLVIVGYFLNEFLFGLGEHFNCPIVVSWISAQNYMVDRYVGNPVELSYVGASPMVKLNLTTFKGRLANFMVFALGSLYSQYMSWQLSTVYKDLFPGYRPLSEVEKRISLVLVNSHFSEGHIRPNTPASIEVGGIQIKDQPDPLPKDLQKIFNSSSEHGVIYLSFGSNIGSDDLQAGMNQLLYDVLSGLDQTVLWKWNSAEKPGNASNIHYQSWLPQDDVLAQPNLRLFITHAGKGGTAEAQYHGVPMVAIPFAADQHGNAEKLQTDGFGILLDRNTLTADILRTGILKVLHDPSYTEKVKHFSNLYRDRPTKAKATSAFWIEYVLRHKGAYHMQSPLVHLNAFQALSLDVISFLLLVIFLVYKVIRISARFVFRRVCGRSSIKQKQQ